jgi:thiamine transport system permease protein
VDRDRAALTVRPPQRLPVWLRAVLVVPPLVFLAVFYAWPVVTLLAEVVRGSTVADTLGRPGLGRVLWFTTWQAALSTAATVAVGMAPAYLLARWHFPGRRLLAAVVVAHVYFNVSVVVRLVGTLWEQLPDDLSAAARTLGASPWQTMRHVTLPLLRPAIAASATVTFLFTFTSFGVVQILGGAANPTLEVEIARRATGLGDIGGAAVLSVVQLLVLGVLVAASTLAQRRATVPLVVARARRRRVHSPGERLGVTVLAMATTLFTVVPIAALVVSSLRPGDHWSLNGWRAVFDSAGTPTRPGSGAPVDTWAALTTSLRYALVATVLSVVIGGLATAAIGAARRRGRLLDVGLMLPLGTSAVTIGFGMLITFDHAPVDWRAAWWLVPLGHALVAVPFVVRAALPVLRARPDTWLDAAATLGASPARAWWEVDARLLVRPLAAGAGLAAAVSLGEFGATTLLSRTGNETLPLAIARLLGRTGDVPRAQADALAVLLAAATMVLMFAAERNRDAVGR